MMGEGGRQGGVRCPQAQHRSPRRSTKQYWDELKSLLLEQPGHMRRDRAVDPLKADDKEPRRVPCEGNLPAAEGRLAQERRRRSSWE